MCDGRPDRRTDTPSYRDARTHLKTKPLYFNIDYLAEFLQIGFNAVPLTSGDEFDISLLEGVIDDGFVFLHHDGTSGVDDVTARTAVRVNGIDGSQEQLLLKSRATREEQ